MDRLEFTVEHRFTQVIEHGAKQGWRRITYRIKAKNESKIESEDPRTGSVFRDYLDFVVYAEPVDLGS